MTTRPRYVCRWCGCHVHYWCFGWKHSRGLHSPPSCGKKLSESDVIKEIRLTRPRGESASASIANATTQLMTPVRDDLDALTSDDTTSS